MEARDTSDVIALRAVEVEELVRVVDELRASRREIKLHPGGFIQLSLASDPAWRVDGMRLHVWSAGLPQRDPRLGIHEHPFEMTSRILLGEIENLDFEVRARSQDDTASHVALEARHSELLPTGQRFAVSCVGRRILRSGDLYRVPKGQFHCSILASPLAVTLIVRSSIDAHHDPRVLAPAGYCEDEVLGSRSVDQDTAWNLIDRALSLLRHGERRDT